jgi:uncharacterized membrane protein
VVNLVFLFQICLLPFLSAWLGHGFDNPFSWGLYCGLLIATSVANIALVLVTTRGGGRLMAAPVSARDRAFRVARSASPGLAFLTCLLVLAAGYLHVSLFCWLLIPLFLWLSRRLFGARAEPVRAPPKTA